MPLSSSDFEKLTAPCATSNVWDLSHQGLDADDLARVVTHLQKYPAITSLNLTGNLLGDVGIQALLKAPTITRLNLMGNNLSDHAIGVLSQLKQLIELNLNINTIGDKGALTLGELPCLQKLLLNGNAISNQGLQTFAQQPSLQYLSLMNNDINSEGARLLMNNKSLHTLYLDNNYLGDDGAAVVAKNSTWQELSLSDNALTASGAEELATYFKGATLNVSANVIEDKGASLLLSNASISNLNLSNNRINYDVLDAFAANTTLTRLDLSYNQVTDQVLSVLAKLPSLTYLDLTANTISHLGLAYFIPNKTLTTGVLNYNRLDDLAAQALGANTSITTLYLSGNAIDPRGAAALSSMSHLYALFLNYNDVRDIGAKALAQSKSLRELYLSYNHISDAAAVDFLQNDRLQCLDLNYNQLTQSVHATLIAHFPERVVVRANEQPADFSQESLSQIFLLSQSLFCIIGKNGLIQFFNVMFCHVLGFDAKDLLGHSLLAFLHPQDRALFTLLFNRPIAKDIVIRFLSKDGDFRSINWCLYLQNECIYMTGTNLGAQKKAEKVLQQLVQQQQAKAMQIKSKQQDFIAHLCHEIRNPVSGVVSLSEVIAGYAKTINDDSQLLLQYITPSLEAMDIFDRLTKSSNAISNAVSDIQLCCRHQAGILDENLALDKMTSAQFTLINKPLNIALLVQEMALMCQAKAQQKGLILHVESPVSDENWVKSDALRLKQIILNLLNNAIQFTEQGSITIKLQLVDQTAQQNRFAISVKDTGQGLKETELAHVFESYQSANLVTGNQYSGSGLGLTIAKQLAQRMGGDIKVNSQWQRGSEFICTLLCDRLNEQERVLVNQSTTTPLNPPTPSTGSHQVLVVEDNEINRKCLCFMLKQAGHRCVIACDGEEAVNSYQQQHALIDMIFMDTLMPKKNGLEAIQEIRQFEQLHHLLRKPIITLSGNAQEQDKAAAFKAGADAYITKPFNKEQVCGVIEQWCAAKIASATSASTPVPTCSPGKH